MQGCEFANLLEFQVLTLYMCTFTLVCPLFCARARAQVFACTHLCMEADAQASERESVGMGLGGVEKEAAERKYFLACIIVLIFFPHYILPSLIKRCMYFKQQKKLLSHIIQRCR